MKRFAALVAVLALVAFAAPAFAANPFMDVPMNHWAYDAVSQLASRGVVSGYPDGAFKGEWKATRYEMASVVARALAYVDMNKASKQDLELLKKLVVEFKDELDALGVKVDELDARVADLEKGVGKWYFSDYLRMQQTFGRDIMQGGVLKEDDDSWNVNRFRWNIKKVIDDKVTMNIRLQGGGGEDLGVELAYLTVKFPWDITANIGRFWLDWEGDFYATDWWGFAMDDAYITDIRPTMAVSFNKSFGMGDFSLYVAHDDNAGPGEDILAKGRFPFFGTDPEGFGPAVGVDWALASNLTSDRYIYGARLNFNFNEMFSLALNYMKYDYEDNAGVGVYYTFWNKQNGWLPNVVAYGPKNYFQFATLAADVETIWGDLVINFKPGITLKGQYFMQDNDPAWQATGLLGGGVAYDDSPSAWKAVLEIDQDVLGFTSLWLEYAQLDAGFVFPNGASPYGWMAGDYFCNDYGQVEADTTLWMVLAMQRWSEKWGTYVRYLDVDGSQDYNNWTVAVTHWYTPSLAFELGYDKLGGDLDDDFIWLRTTVFF